MFLDLLDTIRTSESLHEVNECKMNAIQGESMLFYLLLSGKTPLLTQTQVMDSNIIHSILYNKQNKEHFLNLLQTGKIQVALYTGNGSCSMQDYFKKSLTYGLADETDFFDFSTLPFLNNYDARTRKNLNTNILKSLENNSYQFRTDGVSHEHTDYIEAIFENIQDIDRAIKGKYLYTNGFRKQIDELFHTQCQILINDETVDTEFISLCKEMVGRGGYGNRRSAYYNYLETKKNDFSKDNIEKVKQVIDNCYNEAVASSLPEKGYNLNFLSTFVDLVKPIQKSGGLIKKELIEIRQSKKNSYITWETLGDMLKEVDNLAQKKNLSRTDALNEYKRMQTYKPVVAVAKYLGTSVMTSFIPGVSQVVEIVSDLVSGAAADATGEILKKPSIGEIRNSIKQSNIKSNLASNTIEFISMTMQS